MTTVKQKVQAATTKAKAALAKKPAAAKPAPKPEPEAEERPNAKDMANKHQRDMEAAVEEGIELAAQHLESLIGTVYVEPQAIGALQNAANDLRAGRHIKLEPQAEEAEAE